MHCHCAVSALLVRCQCTGSTAISTKICADLVQFMRIWCLRFEIWDCRSEIKKTPKLRSQRAPGAVRVQSQHPLWCIVRRWCCQHAASAEQRSRVQNNFARSHPARSKIALDRLFWKSRHFVLCFFNWTTSAHSTTALWMGLSLWQDGKMIFGGEQRRDLDKYS